MPEPTDTAPARRVEIPEGFQTTRELSCDLHGSKKPETITVSRNGIDTYIKEDKLQLYFVPQFNMHRITSVACVEPDATSKKQSLVVEVYSPIWHTDPDTGQQIRIAGRKEVESPFAITETDLIKKMDRKKEQAKEFKKSQRLKDVRQARKGMKKDGSIFELIDAIAVKKGEQRIKALDMAKEELLATFEDGNTATLYYLVEGAFRVSDAEPGTMPPWTFPPIYEIISNNDFQQSPDDAEMYNLLTSCIWSLGGARSQAELDQIGALLMDDDIKPVFKKGLIASLGQTGQLAAADIIVEYAKEKTSLDYPMMIIPMALVEDLGARDHYWDLQIHYAERLAEELYPMETFLGSYYYKYDFEKLDDFTHQDLEAIDQILDLLEKREAKFQDEWNDHGPKSHQDTVQHWQDIRDLIESRL